MTTADATTCQTRQLLGAAATATAVTLPGSCNGKATVTGIVCVQVAGAVGGESTGHCRDYDAQP